MRNVWENSRKLISTDFFVCVGGEMMMIHSSVALLIIFQFPSVQTTFRKKKKVLNREL